MDNKLLLWLYAFVPLAVITIILFVIDLIYKDKFERQKEKEFRENVTYDAKDEPHVLRLLGEFERNILIKEHKIEYQVAKLNHYIIPLFAAAFLAIAYFAYKYQYWNGIIIYPIIIVASIFGSYYYRYIRENNLNKDLRSPVFAAKGELLKRKEKERGGDNSFFVRGVEFKDRENPQIDKYWKDWGAGITVYVEYSPFTKHIWKIEKV